VAHAHDDRNVAMLVSNPQLRHKIIKADVETRQIAPTILRALSLDPKEPQAIHQEHTAVLPGIELAAVLFSDLNDTPARQCGGICLLD
jgi:hypothetical protein